MDSKTLHDALTRVFGFGAFRPHQEAACLEVLAGKDILVVMPTGAGKSLCYQLPGYVRPGTVLVISPLIALIEDQVQKLCQRGLRAASIHSGRDRLESRAVCRHYIAGELDYLFVAPERLGVPGFLELLKQGELSLIAVDEAHCISHWGHDFRPEYRLLGERLKDLRSCPVMALTATATPLVQDDIVAQLRLKDARRHIHGFRRENLAIEVMEAPRDERANLVAQYLSDKKHLPALVYAPTRKLAEEVALKLSKIVHCRAYHAGLPSSERAAIQEEFLSGRLPVVVATIAFGMGVDKADIRTVLHFALPGSVENYYQEIGRAGRDGAPARAVLFYSHEDCRTHEFFLKKNYPKRAVLEELWQQVVPPKVHKLSLQTDLELVDLDAALEKLWVHGAVRVDHDDFLYPGRDGWQKAYDRQRAHKANQLALMEKFAGRLDTCRMLQLIQHFGDQDDAHTVCGHCDVCAPASCITKESRSLTEAECRQAISVLGYLAGADAVSWGRVLKEGFSYPKPSREEADRLLQMLAEAGLLAIHKESFKKAGKNISYRAISVTQRGQTIQGDELKTLQVSSWRRRFSPRPARRPRRTAATGARRAAWQRG